MFPAMSISPDGNLYTVILPADPRIGLRILSYDLTGKLKSSNLYRLPLGKKAPADLTFIGGSLALIFPDGEILEYEQ
jgi:hypothetical protein